MIWEYYDPLAIDEIEANPKKRISLSMGYAFMISSLAVLFDMFVHGDFLGIILVYLYLVLIYCKKHKE